MGTLLLSLALVHSSLFAASLVEDVREQLSSQAKVSGQFQQTKFVKDMNVKLESSGDFVLDKKTGLTWNQKVPFEFSFKADSRRIEMTSPGSKPEVLTKDSQPLLFGFSQTFLSLFSGDTSALNEKFDIKATGDKKKWNFEFSPKDDLVKKAIRAIRVQGGSSVQMVFVEDGQGNTMNIQLKAVK